MSLLFAVSAGFCASISSISGKFAFSSEYRPVNPLLVFCALAAFILSYVLMWWTHTRALSLSSSTVVPLVVNTATNFIVSGMAGLLLFGEKRSLLWWMGLPLIVCGTFLIMSEGTDDNKKKD